MNINPSRSIDSLDSTTRLVWNLLENTEEHNPLLPVTLKNMVAGRSFLLRDDDECIINLAAQQPPA
jgi:hypothetical protein